MALESPDEPEIGDRRTRLCQGNREGIGRELKEARVRKIETWRRAIEYAYDLLYKMFD